MSYKWCQVGILYKMDQGNYDCCPGLYESGLVLLAQDTRQYLVWDQDAEEDSEDCVATDLFAAIDKEMEKGTGHGTNQKLKKKKSGKGDKKKKKSKGKKKKNSSSRSSSSGAESSSSSESDSSASSSDSEAQGWGIS